MRQGTLRVQPTSAIDEPRSNKTYLQMARNALAPIALETPCEDNVPRTVSRCAIKSPLKDNREPPQTYRELLEREQARKDERLKAYKVQQSLKAQQQALPPTVKVRGPKFWLWTSMVVLSMTAAFACPDRETDQFPLIRQLSLASRRVALRAISKTAYATQVNYTVPHVQDDCITLTHSNSYFYVGCALPVYCGAAMYKSYDNPSFFPRLLGDAVVLCYGNSSVKYHYRSLRGWEFQAPDYDYDDYLRWVLAVEFERGFTFLSKECARNPAHSTPTSFDFALVDDHVVVTALGRSPCIDEFHMRSIRRSSLASLFDRSPVRVAQATHDNFTCDGSCPCLSFDFLSDCECPNDGQLLTFPPELRYTMMVDEGQDEFEKFYQCSDQYTCRSAADTVALKSPIEVHHTDFIDTVRRMFTYWFQDLGELASAVFLELMRLIAAYIEITLPYTVDFLARALNVLASTLVTVTVKFGVFEVLVLYPCYYLYGRDHSACIIACVLVFLAKIYFST